MTARPLADRLDDLARTLHHDGCRASHAAVLNALRERTRERDDALELVRCLQRALVQLMDAQGDSLDDRRLVCRHVAPTVADAREALKGENDG